MNGPTGYNVRYRNGEGRPVVLRLAPSTMRDAIDVSLALEGFPEVMDVEIWRSGEQVWPAQVPA